MSNSTAAIQAAEEITLGSDQESNKPVRTAVVGDMLVSVWYSPLNYRDAWGFMVQAFHANGGVKAEYDDQMVYVDPGLALTAGIAYATALDDSAAASERRALHVMRHGYLLDDNGQGDPVGVWVAESEDGPVAVFVTLGEAEAWWGGSLNI